MISDYACSLTFDPWSIYQLSFNRVCDSEFMNQWIKYLDYFFISRPILFFPGWATMLAGYFTSQGKVYFFSLNMDNLYPEIGDASLYWGMLGFSLAMGGSFILNQIRDLHSDSENSKLFLLGDGHIPMRHGYFEGILFIAASLVISLEISFLFLMAIAGFILVTGYLYNFPPFGFKDKPIAGLLANMMMGWLAFAAGWVIFSGLSISLIYHSLPYLFFNTSLYFLTTLPDMKGDASSEKFTFPVRYGTQTTIGFSLIFFIAALISSIIIGDLLILIVLILCGTLMIHLMVRKNIAAAILAIKMSIFSFCIVLSIKLPLFFVILAALFFLTRFYYKRRFHFDYPNFRGV